MECFMWLKPWNILNLALQRMIKKIPETELESGYTIWNVFFVMVENFEFAVTKPQMHRDVFCVCIWAESEAGFKQTFDEISKLDDVGCLNRGIRVPIPDIFFLQSLPYVKMSGISFNIRFYSFLLSINSKLIHLHSFFKLSPFFTNPEKNSKNYWNFVVELLKFFSWMPSMTRI